jgi:cellulose synthase/poly-beta-1,6-N-acetylglucosamine synthase-like glycosyltransferase
MTALLIFCLCALILICVFLGYPAIVIILSSIRKQEKRRQREDHPTVSILFAAHNEAQGIRQKLENALTQEYPRDKIEVIIVDDGSTDRTAEIIRETASPLVKLLQHAQRRGKTAALNLAVAEARGEILVFTDANAIFQPDAVRQLVQTFDAEGKIGVVCGELQYQPHPMAVSDVESRYWNLEIRLKKAESQLGTLLGANGSIYAMPKSLYIPLRDDLISDFIEPLLLSRKGYRTVYQPNAVSVETGTRSLASDYRRKKRIIQRGLYGLIIHHDLLNPLKSGWLACQLWAHKVLRWLTPLWLLGLFLATLALQHYLFFKIILILQIIAYLLGGFGILLQLLGRTPGLFRLPAYILMTLAASVAGLWGLATGQKVVTWEPQR